jgi:beta-aspartyl-peptidase (threonine type)
MASTRTPALYGVLIAVAGLLIAAPVVAALLLRTPSPNSDREAIREVLLRQQAAWNEHNLEEFMAGYWHAPDLAFVSGSDATSGWEATLERYRKRYQAEGREMGRLTFSDLDIEPRDGENAVVHGRWQVITTKETLAGRFTLTFRKLAEGWRIVRDETTLERREPTSGATNAN